ncbi:hypothetical protein LCGC14_2830860, partial [marine sediment metagenome]
ILMIHFVKGFNYLERHGMQEEQNYTTRDGEEFQLRPARAGDAEQIVDNLNSTSQERSYILTEYCGSTPDKCRIYIEGMDHERNLLIVAEGQSKVVGTLGVVQYFGGQREELKHILALGLHISGPFRGKGIGTRMLEYADTWAREQGFKKITACIFTTNQRSLVLFEKMGYTQESLKRMQIRIGSSYIDEVCMAKVLG